MSYLPSMPEATLMDMFRSYPELAGPLHEFAQALMRSECQLSAADRELLASYVSVLNGCDFCRDAHGLAMHQLDGETPEIDVLMDEPNNMPVREPLRPVLRFVRKLNDDPVSIMQDDIDAMLDAGWDERAISYAVVLCGFFNLMNRWVDGLGLFSDDATVESAGRMLASDGYSAITEMLNQSRRGS